MSSSILEGVTSNHNHSITIDAQVMLGENINLSQLLKDFKILNGFIEEKFNEEYELYKLKMKFYEKTKK